MEKGLLGCACTLGWGTRSHKIDPHLRLGQHVLAVAGFDLLNVHDLQSVRRQSVDQHAAVVGQTIQAMQGAWFGGQC
eukprot:311225-Chlamydomonas_euryale.AAC.1